MGNAPESSKCAMSHAWMMPSASTLIVASTRSWRACADAMRFSRRSSVHLTVALSMCAAMTTEISSRPTNDFRPKPPPTSPICTRTLFSGTPVARENTNRASCGFWLACHTSRRWSNGSQRAVTARHSIGTAL